MPHLQYSFSSLTLYSILVDVELLKAAEKGQTDDVKRLIASEANLHYKDKCK